MWINIKKTAAYLLVNNKIWNKKHKPQPKQQRGSEAINNFSLIVVIGKFLQNFFSTLFFLLLLFLLFFFPTIYLWFFYSFSHCKLIFENSWGNGEKKTGRRYDLCFAIQIKIYLVLQSQGVSFILFINKYIFCHSLTGNDCKQEHKESQNAIIENKALDNNNKHEKQMKIFCKVFHIFFSFAGGLFLFFYKNHKHIKRDEQKNHGESF